MKKLMFLTTFLGTMTLTLMLAQIVTTSTTPQPFPKATIEVKKDTIEPNQAIGRGTPKKGLTAAPPPRMDGTRDTTGH